MPESVLTPAPERTNSRGYCRMKLWSSLNVRYPIEVTMTCSRCLNFEPSHWVRIGQSQSKPSSERKMLVSDPPPRRIPEIVGTNHGTFTNPPSTRCAKLYR